MPISDKHLNILRTNGLLISKPFVPTHILYPNGYVIGKPKSVGGNSRVGYELFWEDKILCDAPCSFFYEKNGKYFFAVSECIPGPGEGDFVKVFVSPDETVDAILEYYFGDTISMNHSRSK